MLEFQVLANEAHCTKKK
jgi:hypothetical protein